MGTGILMLSLCKSCGLLSYTTKSFKAKYAGLKCGQRSLHSPSEKTPFVFYKTFLAVQENAVIIIS